MRTHSPTLYLWLSSSNLVKLALYSCKGKRLSNPHELHSILPQIKYLSVSSSDSMQKTYTRQGSHLVISILFFSPLSLAKSEQNKHTLKYKWEVARYGNREHEGRDREGRDHKGQDLGGGDRVRAKVGSSWIEDWEGPWEMVTRGLLILILYLIETYYGLIRF